MKRIALTIAVATLGLAALVGAQADAQGMGPGMMMGQGGRGWSQMIGAYDQGWFDALHTKLAITPAQQGPWDSYVAAARASAAWMVETHNAVDFDAVQKMAPKDQIDFMRKMHAARLDQLTRVVDARDALLKVLAPHQQSIAQTALGGYGLGFGPMMGQGGGYGQMPGPAGHMGNGGAPCFGPPAPPSGK